MNKKDLALSDQQRLICHKTQPNQIIYIIYIYIYIRFVIKWPTMVDMP